MEFKPYHCHYLCQIITSYHLAICNLQCTIPRNVQSTEHKCPRVRSQLKSVLAFGSCSIAAGHSCFRTPKADWPLQIGVRDRRTHRQKQSRAQECKSRKLPRINPVTLVTRHQCLRKDPGSSPTSPASTAFTAGPHLDGKPVQRIRGHQRPFLRWWLLGPRIQGG